MRKLKTALPLAATLLFAACSNEVEHYNGPIVYDNVIVDNYPKLWSVQHRPERGNGAPMLDFTTPELPQFNNDQSLLVGTYGGIMAIDMETGQELWFYAMDASMGGAVVSDYILSENSEFIILRFSALEWTENLYIRLNLRDGSEQWRKTYKTRTINLNGDCARVGDSHLYLSLLVDNNDYAAYRLNMQTSDTTRLLRTAPDGEYTHTQCYIHSINYDQQEHWIVTEGLYNPTTQKDIWRMHIRNTSTGDTLGYRIKIMPTELPDNVAQKYAPEGIAQINDERIIIYNTVWINVIDIYNLKNSKKRQTYRVCDTTWFDSIYHQEGCKYVTTSEEDYNKDLERGFDGITSKKSILINATAPSNIEAPTTHQILSNNDIILRTNYKRWIIKTDGKNGEYTTDIKIQNKYFQTAHKSLGYSNRNIPTTNHNMIDGIFYEAGGSGCLQAFEFESSRQLMKIVLTGSTPVHTGTMAYKNSKGEVFVVFCDRNEVVCFPGLTSSHHKVNMIDLLKNTKNIR